MNINKMIQLAVHHYQSGNLKQAEQLSKKVLLKQPNNPDILYFLGTICVQLENFDPAINYIKRSIYLNQDNSEAYFALGLALKQKGLFDDAIDAFKEFVQRDSSSAEAFFTLGKLLNEKGQLDEAIKYFQQAIQVNPNYIEAYHILAAAFVNKWQLDEAIHICKRILQINSSYVLALYILGNILMTRGKLDEAELSFRQALQIKPNELKTNQALLMLTSYSPKFNADTILSEHLHVAEQFEQPLRLKMSPHTNEPLLNRRLKIAYVSPDFKSHSVAYFIEPVIIAHNKDLYEIFCYSDVSAPDQVTERIKVYANHYKSIVGMSNEDVAKLIRKEQIDILIDLTGHTGGVNRILLFANKPAPVQASWIGYPSTTGLSSIDYKIVDSYTDPIGIADSYYSEKLLRLPDSFLCYLPDKDSPNVGNPPVLISDYITFGSFNNFPKIVPEVIFLWSKILKMVPSSHLIMKSLSFFDKTTCSLARNLFIQEGIESERVELLQPLPAIKDHLRLYNHIDIALDTFPYNGTTTTCEALWMGVPVVTFAGNTHASRVGLSLLSNVGLHDFIANTNEEYIEIAINLANNLERLKSLRENLRSMIKLSPLCDAKRFTENLEMCYRNIWEAWCKSV